MTCSTLWTLVHEYLDGELPPRQLAAFEARLSVCAGCQDAVDVERVMLERVRRLMRNPAAPHWLGARISAAIAAQASAPPAQGDPGTGGH